MAGDGLALVLGGWWGAGDRDRLDAIACAAYMYMYTQQNLRKYKKKASQYAHIYIYKQTLRKSTNE